MAKDKIPLPRPDPREPDEYDVPEQGLTAEQFARIYRREPITDTDMMQLIQPQATVGGGRHQIFTGVQAPEIPATMYDDYMRPMMELMTRRHDMGAARIVDDPYAGMPSSDVSEPKMEELIQRKYQPPGGYNPDIPVLEHQVRGDPQEYIDHLLKVSDVVPLPMNPNTTPLTQQMLERRMQTPAFQSGAQGQQSIERAMRPDMMDILQFRRP